MNPVLILSYNGLPQLKKCVESVRKQNIPVNLFVADNGSKDGTQEWIRSSEYVEACAGRAGWYDLHETNTGFSRGINLALDRLFSKTEATHCLCLNQDLVLPSSFYGELLKCDVPFVTGFPVSTEFEIGPLAAKPQTGLTPYPCFSAFLIRRWAWEMIGPLNEEMFSWASDCDYHVRGHRLGVGMWKSGVPFYHESGSTMRNAPEEERQWFIERADKDREVFKSLYGCKPGDPEYSELFR